VTAHELWRLEGDQALQALGVDEHGLTTDEVAARHARYGMNELPAAAGISMLRVFIRQFRSPLIYILMIAAVVTLVIEEYIDAGIIVTVIAFNSIIGTVQEYRAERSMEALRRVATMRAHVVRDGHERDIDAREFVPGDIVIIEAGARVPADCRLLSVAALETDESLITGESTTVAKDAHVIGGAVPVGDRTNMVIMGSIATRGRARG